MEAVEIRSPGCVRRPGTPTRLAPKALQKIRRSIEEYGVVENLVARPHPEEDGALALNYALNRAALIDAFGGLSVRAAHLPGAPANYPSYQPYRPYTTNPGPCVRA